METTHAEIDWVLDDLVRRLPGVRSAVVLSRDGMLIARSTTMERSDAEQLSAVSSALYGLATAAGDRFRGGHVQQAVIEMDSAVMFVTAGGPHACLALWAEETADMAMVAFEINHTVRQVGAYLSAQPRFGASIVGDVQVP